MRELIDVGLPLSSWAKVVVALRAMRRDDYTELADVIKNYANFRPSSESSNLGSDK